MNISAHIHFFEQEMRRRNYSERTIKNYSTSVNCFFSKSQSDHPKNIHENEIREYLNKFSIPNTQRSIHGAIKKYYDICLRQKEKFKYIPYCRKDKKLPIVLSVEEIQGLFNVCDNLKHKVILAILYGCGLRVSELLNLKWSHIDRSRMVINVIQGKGKKDRQVTLVQPLVELLISYYYAFKSNEYVLNGQFGLQYSERGVNEVLKQLAFKSCLKNKKIHAHLIRHCYATHLVENGTDINLIQRLLGHSSPKTTAIYTHISNNLISKINSPINAIQM